MNEAINSKNIDGFSESCRICLETRQKMIPITILKVSDDMILVLNFFNIQVIEDDRYPNKVCNNCVLQLKKTIFFKDTCQKSLEILNAGILHENYNKKSEKMDKLEINKSSKWITNSGVCLDDNNYINGHLDNKNRKEENVNCMLNTKENEISNRTLVIFNHILVDNKKQFESNLNLNVPYSVNNYTSSILNEINYTPNSNVFIKRELEDNFEVIEECQEEDKHEVIDNNELIEETEIKNEDNAKSSKLDISITNSEIYFDKNYRNVDLEHKNKFENINCILDKKDLKKDTVNSENEIRVDNKKKFECTVCKAKFTYKYTLNKHQKLKHSKIYDETHKDESDGEKKKYFCWDCKKYFGYRSNLYKHQRIYHGKARSSQTVCEDCGETFTNIQIHRKYKHSEHKCHHCECTFTHKSSLIHHLKKHTKIKVPDKALCTLCGNYYRSLNGHMKTKHSNERNYQCKHCDRKFKTNSQWRAHERITHSNIRPFKCPHCQKTFHLKQSLKNHLRIHTGERPFVCAICLRAFTQNSSLSTHTKLVHGKPLNKLISSVNLNL